MASKRSLIRHYANNTFKRIFSNKNVRITIKPSLKSGPKGPINNIRALFQIVGWHWQGDKPLSERVMARSPTHVWYMRLSASMS